jgi:hypothetical protein
MTIERGRELLQLAKDRIRSRRSLAFFDAAYEALNRPPNDGLDWYQRWPHMSLLIAKWSLASWRPEDDRPAPGEDDFAYVFQTTYDAIGTLHRVYGNTAIFLRRLLLQQIWFQRGLDTGALARQYRIIEELMAGSDAVRRFTQSVRMTPGAFTRQLAHMAGDMGDALKITSLSEQRPRTARHPEQWLAVRALYAKTIPELHAAMRRLEDLATPAEVEICEQSPLIRTPFADTDHGPVCIHHKLLFRMLETAVFDLARSLDVRPFMDAFGPAYEQYVAEVLADLGSAVIRERELQDLLRGEGRVVDFAMPSDDALVLLDAKGFDGHYDELYHNLPATLAARMRTSLLGAVDQAVQTSARLPAALQRREVYFVCVTFKQVAIGDGAALRELTAGTPEWDHGRWTSAALPPQHMFFVSIHDLENMVSLALAQRTTLSALVRGFVQTNADPATRRALPEMHMMGQERALPPSVQAAADRLRR